MQKLGSWLVLPEMTKIFRELKNRGFDINTNIYTVEQAKQEILSKLKGTKIC